MNPNRILVSSLLASLCLLSEITWAQVVTEFSSGMTAGAGAFSIAAGPDGNLWFTEFSLNRIGKITTLGVITEYGSGITTGADPDYITAGPDGNLWFTEDSIDSIGKITTAGVVIEYSSGITAGADPSPPSLASFGCPAGFYARVLHRGRLANIFNGLGTCLIDRTVV